MGCSSSNVNTWLLIKAVDVDAPGPAPKAEVIFILVWLCYH